VTRTPDEWIVIPNWQRFQHYKTRNPPWIKNYRELLHKDEYLDLPLAARGLLHGLWLAYAEWDGRLRVSDLGTAMGHLRDTHGTLGRLNDAGLLDVVASRPLSLSLDLNQELHARARENGRVCEFCEVGGGRHAADCPAAQQA
jgi:hypothetical protein